MSIEPKAGSPAAERDFGSESKTEDASVGARKDRRREIKLLAASVLVAAGVGLFQSCNLHTTLQSNAAATIYAQQQDIDKIFVEMPHMQPYFWEDQGLPDPAKQEKLEDGKLTVLVVAQADAVASRILDHFEHLILQMETLGVAADKEGWKAYIDESFKQSPTLCQTLWDDRREYGGTGPTSMWAEYAKDVCPEVRTS